MCGQGASVIQTTVLDAIADPSVRVYVAWVPILPEDTIAPDDERRRLIADERTMHFWDSQRSLPAPFSTVLGLPEGWPAWDVYLAYPPGLRWQDAPPAPRFWHHQLGDLAIAPKLDGEAFATQLRSMLAEE